MWEKENKKVFHYMIEIVLYNGAYLHHVERDIMPTTATGESILEK